MERALDDLMAALSALAGRTATPEDRRAFQRYLDLFIRWNRVHRMTALDSPAAIVRDLFLDSLLYLALLPAGPLKVVDIGAGAGVPGLPLRLADRRIQLTLIDSRRKRVSFLLAACRELALSDVTVREGRAEELVRSEPMLSAVFDVVVTRAAGPIASLVPVTMQFLKYGGILLAASSPGSPPCAPLELVQVPVPGSNATRSFLKGRREGNVPRGT